MNIDIALLPETVFLWIGLRIFKLIQVMHMQLILFIQHKLIESADVRQGITFDVIEYNAYSIVGNINLIGSRILLPKRLRIKHIDCIIIEVLPDDGRIRNLYYIGSTKL